MEKPRIAVIGSGPGGLAAAVEASRLGTKVMLIEKNNLGGVCLNEGCIPTKTLLAYGVGLKKAKKFLNEIERGMRPDSADWMKAQKGKNALVESFRKSTELLLRAHKVKVIRGEAEFQNQNTLSISRPDGKTEILQADRIILAAGSRPKKLALFDWNNPNVLDTTKALELEKAPRDLIIIGGGVNGLEFATLFHFFGTEVTIIEQEPTLLPGFDKRIVQESTSYLKTGGIKVLCGQKGFSVEYTDKDIKLRLVSNQEIIAEKILVAVGRTPNSQGLGLENLGVELDEREFIVVNEEMETNILGIFAIGDVASPESGRQGNSFLANLATAEGKVAARNALGKPAAIDYSVVPKVIWTYPEIAFVGLTEEEAKKQGIETKVERTYFRMNPLAQILEEPADFCQIVTDNFSGKILGGQIIGYKASEHIHNIVAMMEGKMAAHLTLAETIWEAIKNTEGR